MRDIGLQDAIVTDVVSQGEYPHALATPLERNAETTPGNDFGGLTGAMGVAMITPSASLTDSQGPYTQSTCGSASQDANIIASSYAAGSSDPADGGRDPLLVGVRRENGNFDLTSQDAEFLASFPDIFLEADGRNHELFMTPGQDFDIPEWVMADLGSEQPIASSAPAVTRNPACTPPGAPTTDDPSSNCPTNHFRFDHSVRDHVLAFAVDACEPEHLSAVVSAFPTCEGLETLARTFLCWHVEQEDTFIHGATFIVNEVRTELLMAVVAGGAVRSPSHAVQRFGFALHRVLGTQLAKLVGRRSYIPPLDVFNFLSCDVALIRLLLIRVIRLGS